MPVYYGAYVFTGLGLPMYEQMLLGMDLGYPVQGRPVLMLLGRDFLADKKFVYDGVSGAGRAVLVGLLPPDARDLTQACTRSSSSGRLTAPALSTTS